MQNCPQFIAAYYAILRAGAVVVPVNPMNKADEFRHYATDSAARVVVCAADAFDTGIGAGPAVGRPDSTRADDPLCGRPACAPMQPPSLRCRRG
ncbi:AMP-binding protein [Cupriavidus basilensis]